MLFAAQLPNPEKANDPANAGLIARGLPSRRILMVGHDPQVRWLVNSTASALRAEVRSVEAVEQVSEWLAAAVVDLVVVCGVPAASNAESVLSAVRQLGRSTPCMIVSFVHPCLAQVTVSESSGRPASTKVVDFENLARLPSRLIAGEDPWICVD